MPCVAHLMLVMLRLTPFVAHLMLVMILNMPEQCSFQDLLFHLPFMPIYAEKSASRMDISLVSAGDADRTPSPSWPKELKEAGERKGGGNGVLSPKGRAPRRLLAREERERRWSNGGSRVVDKVSGIRYFVKAMNSLVH